ncbi:MAG: carbohydrate binding family 9 domain-containing protein [Bacteroidia bacterium]|nr:carbohydrate binding family 9 domain-containing protein [Bacteroidia bacterium]MBT8278551.1 carbohydrate binding family 9 domain-containing protein [Bacteroidia bacterium]NND25029.1 carbohydrate binding family 9 domain-containing protein [Flavobacteriaceae bacterium]NNK59555.1 carbohydrate binding family 9 domain-containing protein [Flavobacteriaceae bacterium]RZW55941.1 MAG: hydrolase [Flavobacteriaceae bacterium]
MKVKQPTLLFIVCLLIQSSFSQESATKISKRIYNTKSVKNLDPIDLDGIINDAAWDAVEWAGDFIEWRPDENTAPSQDTKFKIVYDDKFLYVGIRAFDKAPDSIVKRLGRRDSFDGDWVEINIDSYHDLRTGFSFTASAMGVKGDEFISNNGNNWDGSWNPIWYLKSQIDEQGWSCEMKIPLSQLRFNKDQNQVWGIQVQRRFFRKEERSLWQRVPQDAPGWVSEMGELHGLVGLTPQKQLEIQPFTVLQYDTFPVEEGNPFRDGSDFTLNGGLDAKIGVTNDLTLDLTINPDFGQVDADPAAITLDGFEIFFQERRPFFVENKNIFDYRFANGQDNLFFSRRIGRSPQGFPSTSAGDYVDQPQNTTILGAAKFSGKTKNGWSIGILESLTSKEYAEIDTNGDRRDEIVEPLTNYFVSRFQKDLNERNTFIGGIFTATNRLDMPESLEFLREAAYTGGLDFKHQWKERKFYAEGNLVLSHVTGSEEAIEVTQRSLTHLFQRVDAGHVEVDPTRTSLTGTGGKIEAGKQGGGNWRYNAGFIWRSPELELNDIGFLRQADEIRQFANVRWRTTKATGKFRQIAAGLFQFSTYDYEGNFNRIQYEFNFNANLLSNWWFDFGAAHKPRIYTNTILQGGPRWRFSQENFMYSFVGTDQRKKLRSSLGFVYSQAKQNNFSFLSIQGDVTYQPTDALRISISPELNRNPNKTQYVTQTDFNGTPRYILGTIDNDSFSAAIRLNYTINPNLTVQYYGQPFIFRATYNDFKYVTNPIANDLNDRFYQYGNNEISFDENSGAYLIDEDGDSVTDYAFGNPDFSFVQFRSNLVVRWEYIPGSELFFVWSQGVTGLVDTDLGLLSGLENGIFNKQPENIFLIKATYRFVL